MLGPVVTAVATAATATAAAILPPILPHPSAPLPPPPGGPLDVNPTECRLMGPFAIFVQLALGGLALLSLVYKRWRERPQRPVKIWFFDVSKQVFGSVLVHIANVFMSMLTSGRFSIKVDPTTVVVGQAARRVVGALAGRVDEVYVPNPCSFYLLNLAIDTTLGIPVLIVLLRLTTKLVARTSLGKPLESIESGHYGNPPKAWWWLKQSIIYFCGLMGMKVCVLILFMLLPWISHVGDWALSWTEGNEKLQIVFVMMLFPLIMNAMQYYIIDSFIKGNNPSDESRSGDAHTDGGGAREGGDLRANPDLGSYDQLTISDNEDDDSSEDEAGAEDGFKRVHVSARSRCDELPARGREYDPARDGDSHTSGAKGSRGNFPPKELIPPE